MCATVGAAVVAIVGGLLVSRFVTLDSAQEGADRRVAELRTRLENATVDAEAATRELLHHDIEYALDDDAVYDALIESYFIDQSANPRVDVPMTILRELTDLDGLSEREVELVIKQIAEEMTKALSRLSLMVPKEVEQEQWSEFKRGKQLPVERDPVWMAAYEYISDLQREAAQAVKAKNMPFGFNLPAAMVIPQSAFSRMGNHNQDARRRLRELLDGVKAEECAVGRQLAIALEDRAGIIKPKGLISGLVVLLYLAAVSIVLPVVLLTPAPAQLSDTQAIIVSAFFLSGVLVLFVYMGWLALRLRDGKP